MTGSSDVCELALPEPGALALAADKRATLELARELGVPTPRTAVVDDAPRGSGGGPGAGLAGGPEASVVPASRPTTASRPSASATRRTMPVSSVSWAASPGGCRVLLQEYGAGEAHGVELLLSRGRPLAAFQHRRLHEVPITGGASSLRESVPLSAGALPARGRAARRARVDGARHGRVQGRARTGRS